MKNKFFIKQIFLIIIINIMLLPIETHAHTIKGFIDFETNYDDTDSMDSICQDFAPGLRIIGYLILVVKIALPLVIIVKGTIDAVHILFKPTPEEIKSTAKKISLSVIGAIFIFFIPTIINIVFGFISSYNPEEYLDAKVCSECLFDPFGEVCSEHVK